jgi:hypothetical protein
MPDSRLGKRLINVAKSAQAIAKREADPEAYGIHVPGQPRSAGNSDQTQNEFAFPGSLRHHYPRYAIGNKIGAIPTEQRVSS